MFEDERRAGWYLAAEVGWLAGVSGRKVGQWARNGYIQSSRSQGSPRVYSFRDVAEAMVVHCLLHLGIPLHEIRRTIAATYEQYGDWPLQTAPLDLADVGAGPPVILRREIDGARTDIARRPGRQQWLPTLGEIREIAAALKRGGWARIEHPEIGHIEVDPNVLSGWPVVAGHRVAADMAGRMGRDDEGRERLREDYDLSDDEITDAVRWYGIVENYAKAA